MMFIHDTRTVEEIPHQLIGVDRWFTSLFIYRVSTIQGGAGFLPSTVWDRTPKASPAQVLSCGRRCQSVVGRPSAMGALA